MCAEIFGAGQLHNFSVNAGYQFFGMLVNLAADALQLGLKRVGTSGLGLASRHKATVCHAYFGIGFFMGTSTNSDTQRGENVRGPRALCLVDIALACRCVLVLYVKVA